MSGDLVVWKASLLLTLALAGCAERKPMLTWEALVSAAERCGAGKLRFSKPMDASVPPSFSYLDPGPYVENEPTAVSTCLAEALKGYNFHSMEIRMQREFPTAR